MPVSPEQLYEQTLVVRAQIGDEAAFEELMKRNEARLRHFTERMMQSALASVPDLQQEIWLAIYRGLPSLLEPAKFRIWAFRIARDQIYKVYRKRSIPLQPLDETSEAELPHIEDDPPSAVDREELQLGLKALSPEHRETLLLHYFEDLSYDEIARITGISVGTVRSRLHYAKQALKTFITQHQHHQHS